jgi:ketosteroid isomerase-like protein
MKYYALCLSLVLGSLAFARPDATGDARKAIKKEYSEMAKAFADKRFTDFSSFMTEDFKASREGHPGSLTRDQVMKDFTGQREQMKEVKWTKKIDKFDLKDGVAHAFVEGKMSATVSFGEGKTQHMDLQAKSVDDWVKVGPYWKLKSSRTTDLTVKIDGKVTPMG